MSSCLVNYPGRVTETAIDSAVAARYRDPALAALATTSAVNEHQLGHRSVRSFLSDPVTDDQLTAIVAAAFSAPTSSNLQTWSARGLAAAAGARVEATDYLESMLLGVIDATLAAQNAIVAASSLGLGTVCVGGARNQPEEIAAEIGLPPGAFVVFGLAVGVLDPAEEAGVKPRLPQSVVLHHETYSSPGADDLAAYDERLGGYNATYGLGGGWSERVLARLVGTASMSGRHRLRVQLERLGLAGR